MRILLALIALPAWGQPTPIIVGAAVSQTGALADLAADYGKALLLWQDEVNAAGGLLGRRVELRLLDDESDARRSGELYAELIRGKTDLLIGPYGSAATLMASAQGACSSMVPDLPLPSTSARRATSFRARCPTPPTAWACWRSRRPRASRAHSSWPATITPIRRSPSRRASER